MNLECCAWVWLVRRGVQQALCGMTCAVTLAETPRQSLSRKRTNWFWRITAVAPLALDENSMVSVLAKQVEGSRRGIR